MARSPSGRHFLPAASVEALYRHCHLKAPVVVMPESAVQFARTVTALARTSEPGAFTAVMLVALPCLPLALAGYELLRWQRGTAPGDLDIGLVAYVGIMAVVLTSWYLARVAWPRWSLAALTAGYALGAACGASMAPLLGGDWRSAAIGATLGGALVTLAQVIAALLRPLRARRAIGAHAGAAVPLLGSRPIHDIVRSRLELAARHLPEVSSAQPPRQSRRLPGDDEQPRLAARLEAELRHLAGYNWHALRPLLGSGASAGDGLTLERAARRVANPDDLPAVLQAALALHGSADAVTLLADVAIVLPKGAPLEAAAPPTEVTRRVRRRSERAEYRNPLAALGDPFWLRCLVDLAWSDRIADRLLARHVVGVEDSVLRAALVQAVGVGRVVRAAGLAPVHADETGALYFVGSDRDPLAYVRVDDATPDHDGTRPQHWLRVPPHVATAREAVAWTFGMSEQTYSPSAET